MTRQPSNTLGAVDINDDGIVDDVQIELYKHLRSVPLDFHGLTTRTAHKFRVKEGKKLMVKNFIDQHGFERVRTFAPHFCGHTMENTIEKLSNSPCFKDDYQSLTIKAARHKYKSKSRVLQR